jgi:hypothetical protein
MKINYAIGHYWEGETGSVGTYNYFGEVSYGTIDEAKELLEYVKKKSPNHDWKIFQLVKMPI